MKKITILTSMFLVLCFGVYAKTPSKRNTTITQEEIKALTTTSVERYAAWVSEHAKAGGNKSVHTNLTVSTKRRSPEDALALITLTSTEKNVYLDAPDIDVYLKPVEIGVNSNGEMTKKDAGATTQLRSGKSAPVQTGTSGKQAELAVGLQVAANANAIEVVIKVIGKDTNQSYESIVALSFDISSTSVGGSSSSETSFFRQPSNWQNNASSFLGNVKPTSNYLPSTLFACRTITVSCSCSGCPGCSTSKSCKENCYPIITSCNPINGTCSLSCCDC